jgi:hypothetical protein
MLKLQKNTTHLRNCTKSDKKFKKIIGISKWNFCTKDNTSRTELCDSSASAWKEYRKHANTYRGINLLNHSYRIYTKVLKEKLKKYSETFLDESQSGCRKYLAWCSC